MRLSFNCKCNRISYLQDHKRDGISKKTRMEREIRGALYIRVGLQSTLYVREGLLKTTPVQTTSYVD